MFNVIVCWKVKLLHIVFIFFYHQPCPASLPPPEAKYLHTMTVPQPCLHGAPNSSWPHQIWLQTLTSVFHPQRFYDSHMDMASRREHVSFFQIWASAGPDHSLRICIWPRASPVLALIKEKPIHTSLPFVLNDLGLDSLCGAGSELLWIPFQIIFAIGGFNVLVNVQLGFIHS